MILRLALDTGATGTMINAAPLLAVGYEPSLSNERVEVTTGSGVEFVPRFNIRRLKALGRNRKSLSVLVHTLPPSAGIDGLLGLDFFRGTVLTIDFSNGTITIA